MSQNNQTLVLLHYAYDVYPLCQFALKQAQVYTHTIQDIFKSDCDLLPDEIIAIKTNSNPNLSSKYTSIFVADTHSILPSIRKTEYAAL